MLRYLLLTGWLLTQLATASSAQPGPLTADTRLENSGPAAGGTPQATDTPAVAPAILLTAEQMPAFPGGEAALLRFLGSRLRYPEAALAHRISGKVHVTFTVDSAGHLRNPQVLKGLGYGLDEEAIRLVRLMPWWTPGRQHGQPAWVQVTMPIVFRAL